MRTDADDLARVRDPAIERLLNQTATLTDEWCSRRRAPGVTFKRFWVVTLLRVQRGHLALDCTSASALDKAGDLACRGLELAAGNEGRWRNLRPLSFVALSRGAHSDAVEYAVQASALSNRPGLEHAIAALAATYAGRLSEAQTHSERMATVAAGPTLLAMSEYVAGEIDSARSSHDGAESHYAHAIELARESGATFVGGIASVGLLAIRAEAGRTDDALRGYRELIDYWERTGSWIQEWTTLRNLARLLHRLGARQPALFLELASDHAPEASAVSDAGPDKSRARSGQDLDDAVLSRIRAEVSSGPRARVLEVARSAIEHHLSAAEGRPGGSTLHGAALAQAVKQHE